MRFLIFLSITLLICPYHRRCNARDTITAASPLSNGAETVVSAGKRFELGFFQPEGNNGSKYVGIWYYQREPPTVVWIANRNKPLLDSIGAVVRIAEDGNLEVVDGKKTTCFSTELERQNAFNRTAKLLDSGNLVFMDSKSGIVWESFKNPTDTFLPGMVMNGELKLTSWATPSNPGTGNYTFQQDEQNEDIYTIKEGETTFHWKSGERSSFFTTKMPNQVRDLLDSSKVPKESSRSSSRYKIRPGDYSNARLQLNSSGQLQFWNWSAGWTLLWLAPNDDCSVYNFCGNFGSCNSSNTPRCTCLRGFVPRYPDNWEAEDFSGGCKRVLEPCHNITEKGTFLDLKSMDFGRPDIKVDLEEDQDNEKGCRAKCLENCQCEAYSSIVNIKRKGDDSAGSECWIWHSQLTDLQVKYTTEGKNLSIRIANSIPGVGQSNPVENITRKPSSTTEVGTVVIVTLVTAAALIVCSLGYISYKRKMPAQRRASDESNPGNPFPYVYTTDGRRTTDFIDEEDSKGTNVSFFKLESILAATENFSDANKLGEGGFGPVYRGTFSGGREIAVKRLSSHSGQGMEEWRNEVVLIAKLQHRNLVRLLGYCVEGNEKILLYEYMPNKSLDAFIFDKKLCISLDWKKRFDIILGIARGLLYLHQDSRLRIIHRDLKTSNILLDEEMNPKISDFGLARIVEGKQTEANTNRVVGTYGYMSPEYALEGLFSVKSDVFSFGAIVLEIVSGKRNTGSYQPKEALNLLGYAWRLWKEEKALDILDHALLESCNKSEVLKCINIGLLCVQEDPNDRPTMSNVVFMLGSESATIPSPNQPAYVLSKRLLSTSSSSSSKPEAFSENKLTISMLKGR